MKTWLYPTDRDGGGKHACKKKNRRENFPHHKDHFLTSIKLRREKKRRRKCTIDLFLAVSSFKIQERGWMSNGRTDPIETAHSQEASDAGSTRSTGPISNAERKSWFRPSSWNSSFFERDSFFFTRARWNFSRVFFLPVKNLFKKKKWERQIKTQTVSNRD